MLQKHRQVLILIVGLLYIYSVCPLLCAAFEQNFCPDASQEMLIGDTGTRGTCCQNTQTNTPDETEKPSESGKSCCATHLELILRDDRHNTHELRESIAQSLVSILPISTILSVPSWESFHIHPVPLTVTFFPDHSLTHRGPPLTEC